MPIASESKSSHTRHHGEGTEQPNDSPPPRRKTASSLSSRWIRNVFSRFLLQRSPSVCVSGTVIRQFVAVELLVRAKSSGAAASLKSSHPSIGGRRELRNKSMSLGKPQKDVAPHLRLQAATPDRSAMHQPWHFNFCYISCVKLAVGN